MAPTMVAGYEANRGDRSRKIHRNKAVRKLVNAVPYSWSWELYRTTNTAKTREQPEYVEAEKTKKANEF